MAGQGTEGRSDPDGPEGIGTPARSHAAPATGEEAHRTPSARSRGASKLEIQVDARASARRASQDQSSKTTGGSCASPLLKTSTGPMELGDIYRSNLIEYTSIMRHLQPP